MIKDSEAAEKLVPMTIDLAKDENRQEELKRNIATLAITDADKIIADEILKAL